jgi:hypothetical protein
VSKAIPDGFSATVAAVESVCAELRSKGSFEPLAPERWVLNIDVAWADPVDHVAFVLDTEVPLLTVYVGIRLPQAAPHGDALAKAIARANHGLLPGCFEIDVETGEMRYRSVLELTSDEVDARIVARLLSAALLMTETYAPAFERIIESGADPLAAVDEIESQA